MTKVSEAFIRDANNVPITMDGLTVSKTMTFDGATTNDPGDYDGTGNPATLFTVTGDVLVHVFGVCTTLLAGASATVEVGMTNGTALLLAQTTATDIDANEVWIDTAPALTEALPNAFIIPNGQDIIQTVATANITAGVITYYAIWRPLNSTGKVVAA
jgi:hypothetical protein